jgi:hypothetical protein
MTELAHVKGVFTGPVALSGLGEASDGQSVFAAGEEWLVTANGVDNGVYVTDTGAWSRRSDLNDSADFVWGKWLQVASGNKYYGSEWYYNGVDNPTLGADTLYFNLRSYGYPARSGPGLEEDPPLLQLPPRFAASFDYFGLSLTERGIASGTVPHNIAGWLQGFKVTWNSPDIVASTGNIYIEDEGNVFNTIDTDEVTPVSLTTNELYYLYTYASAIGTLGLELSPSAPGIGDVGGGYYKDSGLDSTRRYLMTIKAKSAGIPYLFHMWSFGRQVLVRYLENVLASPFEIAAANTSTTAVTRNLGATGTSPFKLVPVSCHTARLRVKTNANAGVNFGNSDAGAGVIVANVPRGPGGCEIDVPLASDQTFTHWNDAASGSTDLHVVGYWDHR